MALTIHKCTKISLGSAQKAQRMCFVQFREIRGIFILDFPEFPKGTVLDIRDGAFCVVGCEKYTADSKNQISQLFLFYNETKDFLPYCDIECIWKSYKANCYDLYKENPYFLLNDMFFPKEIQNKFSFTYWDLLSHVVPTTFQIRREEICMCINEELKKEEELGNTYCEYGVLERRVAETLAVVNHPLTQKEQDISPFLNSKVVSQNPMFYCDMSHLTLHSPVFKYNTYEIEEKIYNGVKDLMEAKNPFLSLKYSNNDRLSDEQNQAVNNALLSDGNIYIITGGPGTGKTTIINEIIRKVYDYNDSMVIKIVAPTGRASKRTEDTIEYRCENIGISTAHKLIGYGNAFSDNEVKDCDLIIFDEASMASPYVFQKLLCNMDKEKTKIILVGDVDQLPSIDPGDILNDLIFLGVPTSYLTMNYRSDDVIVSNSKLINKGISDLNFCNSFELVDTSKMDLSEVNENVVEEASKHMFSEERIETIGNEIIISPYVTEAIDYSSTVLNKEMHAEYAKNVRNLSVVGKYYYYEPVILVKTNYKTGVEYFNGEVGHVIGCHFTDNFLEYEIEISNDRTVIAPAEHVCSAYAITVHKSQGSEYDDVFFIAPKYTSFLTRKILYTAVTRAKCNVKIWSTPQILKKIVRNVADKERKTLLKLKPPFAQKSVL